MEYDLEIPRIIDEIKESSAKTVCLQLPDGLKTKAKEIVDTLQKKFPSVEFIIWGGSNFGGCDIPSGLDRLNVDLLVSFGHSEWK
jgi:diphthamide biosynthesis enzyme Dph1/Dph2-like protein